MSSSQLPGQGLGPGQGPGHGNHIMFEDEVMGGGVGGGEGAALRGASAGSSGKTGSRGGSRTGSRGRGMSREIEVVSPYVFTHTHYTPLFLFIITPLYCTLSYTHFIHLPLLPLIHPLIPPLCLPPSLTSSSYQVRPSAKKLSGIHVVDPDPTSAFTGTPPPPPPTSQSSSLNEPNCNLTISPISQSQTFFPVSPHFILSYYGVVCPHHDIALSLDRTDPNFTRPLLSQI